MDTRYFGNNLIARNQVQKGDYRLPPEAAEDAYYKQHAPAPADGRVLRIGSVAAAVCFGLVTIGSWLR